jgi:hypothetical protein
MSYSKKIEIVYLSHCEMIIEDFGEVVVVKFIDDNDRLIQEYKYNLNTMVDKRDAKCTQK